MSIKIEIAMLKARVDTKSIESIVWELLERRTFHKNSIITIPSAAHPELDRFQAELHSIAFNEIPVSDEGNKNCSIGSLAAASLAG